MMDGSALGRRSTDSGYGSRVRVSAKVDYALRAMLELAAAGDLVKGEQVATAQGIPQKFLERILIDLRHDNLPFRCLPPTRLGRTHGAVVHALDAPGVTVVTPAPGRGQ